MLCGKYAKIGVFAALSLIVVFNALFLLLAAGCERVSDEMTHTTIWQNMEEGNIAPAETESGIVLELGTNMESTEQTSDTTVPTTTPSGQIPTETETAEISEPPETEPPTDPPKTTAEPAEEPTPPPTTEMPTDPPSQTPAAPPETTAMQTEPHTMHETTEETTEPVTEPEEPETLEAPEAPAETLGPISVIVVPNIFEMSVDETAFLLALVDPLSFEDKKVSWYSDDTSIAEVSPNGIVTAKKEGKATITAISEADETIRGTCFVTVNSKPPNFGEITPNVTALTENEINELMQSLSAGFMDGNFETNLELSELLEFSAFFEPESIKKMTEEVTENGLVYTIETKGETFDVVIHVYFDSNKNFDELLASGTRMNDEGEFVPVEITIKAP